MAHKIEDTALQDAAREALEARRMIERAVDSGTLPAWVVEVCNRWEGAALRYGREISRDGSAAKPFRVPEQIGQTVH